MKRTFLYLSLILFVGTLGVVWGTQGTGVIRNDPSRNIFIPDELMMPFQVKAAYNGRDMFFRYRWPSEQPGIYHDMLKFEGGKWVRYGASVPGPQPQGIYEDRVPPACIRLMSDSTSGLPADPAVVALRHD